MDKNEFRKIIFVLGNGFDMDLGLKTSYKDFWESKYCPRNYPARIIKHLNNKWSDNLDAVKWYDLENELLEYFRYVKANYYISTDFLTTKEHTFLKAVDPHCLIRGYYEEYEEQIRELTRRGIIQFNDLGFNAYMTIPFLEDLKKSGQERDKIAVGHIKQGLCDYICEAVKEKINDNSCAFFTLFSLAKAKETGNDVKIYTFNYTSLPNPYDYSQESNTYHIHGNCNCGKIIVGTQDSDEFNKEYDFLQKSFDPNFNPPALVYDLLDADEIVIFGHSIGVNDRQYFKAFFQQQTSTNNPKRKRITIFTRDENSEIEIKRSLQHMTDHNLSTLYGLNDLEIIKTAHLKENPQQFKDFMTRHIKDDVQVMISIQQLISNFKDK